MMSFDVKLPKTPKSAKYVIVACIFVFAVVLLMHTRVLDYIWVDDHATVNSNAKVIHTLGTGDPSTTPSQRVVDTEKEQSVRNKSNANINKKNGEKTDLLHTNDQTSCFMTHELDVQAMFHDQFIPVELLVTKKKSRSLMVSIFSKITASLNLKISLIEPSVLYCILEAKYKELLTKRNFSVSNFSGSKNILTFGVIGDEVPSLLKDENISKFREAGFQPYFVQMPLLSWMQKNSTRFSSGKFASHIFYMYYEWTIHVVVFYKRNHYLWHAALDSDDRLKILQEKDLLFANFDSAYEKFSFVPLATKGMNLSSIYVPSDPQYFLFQIPSSRFLECNFSRAVNIKASTGSSTSDLSFEKFKNRTLIALHELKTFLNPLLMHFWIFSGTMLGWYRQCDIIPYTSDVDFGAWASEIDNLDYIIKYFRNKKDLYILERMGMLDEALEFQLRCDGLRVDVFFMYKINNGSWASGHRPSQGYYFRYHYPHFTLCSADLLQQKVQVPCETEDVIVTEYGSNWMHPVSSWYYESSIKNRGPNIYWDEKRRPNAFQEY